MNKQYLVQTYEIIDPKRTFQGVWIPRAVWINKSLTWLEKLFLVEINSLVNDGGCSASNKYFAKVFNLSTGRCSQIINSLIAKKYITVRYAVQDKSIKKRILNISNNFLREK